MTAVWPATLPVEWLAGTWSEVERTHYDIDETESGHDIRSKKPGSPYSDIGGAFNVDRAGKRQLKAFHKVDCARGSLPFIMADPDEQDLRVFKFNGAPKFTETDPPSPGLYRVTISLLREE